MTAWKVSNSMSHGTITELPATQAQLRDDRTLRTASTFSLLCLENLGETHYDFNVGLSKKGLVKSMTINANHHVPFAHSFQTTVSPQRNFGTCTPARVFLWNRSPSSMPSPDLRKQLEEMGKCEYGKIGKVSLSLSLSLFVYYM